MAESMAVAQERRLPPLAEGSPIVGSAFEVSSDTRKFLFEQYQRLGPVFRVHALHKRYVVLAGPEATLFITRHGQHLLRSDQVWGGMDAAMGASRSLISMDGPDHVRMRAVQKTGFQRGVIEQNLDQVVAMIERSVRTWPKDTALPVTRKLQEMITEQLGTIIAGVSPEGYIDDLILFVRQTLLMHVVNAQPKVMRWSPRYRRAKARTHELGRKVLQAHARRPKAEREGNLIGDLLNLSDADPEFLPSPDLLIGALGPFIAGLDTVASTASFILYVLMQHPDILAQVQDEVDGLFAAGPLTPAALKQLDVLHRVVLETLRMYPIAAAIVRTVGETFEFGGYTIEKGTEVMVATTVAHYLPQFYREPERFDIDRYLPERKEHKQPGAFAPFGAGPHICLGAGFAEVHLMVLVAALLHFGELTMDPADYQLKVDPHPTPHPNNDFRLRVRAR